MQLRIDSRGQIQGVYDEALDLSVLGLVAIQRAGHVEPDPQGRWWADLAPVAGPVLGPFRCRSGALHAELRWLEEVWLGGSAAALSLPVQPPQPRPAPASLSGVEGGPGDRSSPLPRRHI
jgi:hypothetical protein